MGSIISLGIGALEIDWGKNSIGRNHSPLFTSADLRSAPYYYAEEHVQQKPALVRSLGSLVRRLELLGYTIEGCRTEYNDQISAWPDYYPDPVLSFDQFAAVLKAVDVAKIRVPDEEYDDDLGDVARAVLQDPEFAKTNSALAHLSTDDATFFENVHPHVTLRLLAQNERNLARDVVWRFADVVEGGWIDGDAVYQGVPESERILVVTEGSSDAAILRKSLSAVAHDVADFFTFIDMSENYPFTGTGNVYRFCQGLARIRIQNRVLVVLDNDTTGHEAYQRIKRLDLPRRMHVTVLPDLQHCNRVRTLGPTGVSYENVNGRAVSIEWFVVPEARRDECVVRWTSFNAGLDRYQGELLNKDGYTRDFLKMANPSNTADDHTLHLLWDHLIDTCTGDGPFDADHAIV